MRKEDLIKYQKDVLKDLNSKDDKDKTYLISNHIKYSINDIIKEVEGLTPFGIVSIRSWVISHKLGKKKK